MRHTYNYQYDGMRDYRKKVNIFGIRKDVFLEFEFTVGFEELTIELVMPYAAFKEFCETNHVSEINCSEEFKPGFDEMAKEGMPELFDHDKFIKELKKTEALENPDVQDNIARLGDFK